jgi:hypothetical protein
LTDFLHQPPLPFCGDNTEGMETNTSIFRKIKAGKALTFRKNNNSAEKMEERTKQEI